MSFSGHPFRPPQLSGWREELHRKAVLDRDAKSPREEFRRVGQRLQACSLIGVSRYVQPSDSCCATTPADPGKRPYGVFTGLTRNNVGGEGRN
jgi:hypothetical protein